MQTFFSFKWIPIFSNDHFCNWPLLEPLNYSLVLLYNYKFTICILSLLPLSSLPAHNFCFCVPFIKKTTRRPRIFFMKCVVYCLLLHYSHPFSWLMTLLFAHYQHSYSCDLTQWSSSLMHLIILHIYLHNIIIYPPLPPPQFLYPFAVHCKLYTHNFTVVKILSNQILMMFTSCNFIQISFKM